MKKIEGASTEGENPRVKRKVLFIFEKGRKEQGTIIIRMVSGRRKREGEVYNLKPKREEKLEIERNATPYMKRTHSVV